MEENKDPFETAEQLRELWDDYPSIHAQFLDIAHRIEMYGEFGEKERLMIEELSNECVAISAALNRLLSGETK